MHIGKEVEWLAVFLSWSAESLFDKGVFVSSDVYLPRPNETTYQRSSIVVFQDTELLKFLFFCRYFLVDFHAPTTTVESIMEHLSRDIDVIRPNIVKHPLTQEVKECEGIVPVPLEEKLYAPKKRK